MDNNTPKSMRTQIAVFGRTNAGKSSFVNMLAGQDVSIVSAAAGTTTDPVEKTMELRPVGAVVLIDTAGVDDTSALSPKRAAKTEAVFSRADVFVVVTENGVWGEYEKKLAREAKSRDVPMIAVVNKIDLKVMTDDFRQQLLTVTPYVMACSCVGGVVNDNDVDDDNVVDDNVVNDNVVNNNNVVDDDVVNDNDVVDDDVVNNKKIADDGDRPIYIERFRKLIAACLGGNLSASSKIVSDLLPRNGAAILVIPIDTGAPKGRLILPQVQVLRDILDGGQIATVVKDTEYEAALSSLIKKPDLVICDSQVVQKIAALTPPDIPLTTFSILFARFKGDAGELARGAAAVGALSKDARVLIAEACSHHAAGDDIGRVKIPALLRKFVGDEKLRIDHCGGRDYPKNIDEYDLIIHCGACMLTRREMSSRVAEAKNKNVPITNYGVAISYFNGVLERVVKPLGISL